ncbi:MAG: tail-specific protease [Chlamydiota bacterium]|jgi:carboxyl-terminal processing protease
MIRRTWLLFFIILGLLTLEAKPPQLEVRDVQAKVEEVLKAHVCYKKLDHEIASRILQNFIEELDPTKTYFLKDDIAAWLEPSEETLNRVLDGFRKGDFVVFREIHETYMGAIERRSHLASQIDQAEMPDGVKNDEFKDLQWVTSEQELVNRLVRIKALQLAAADRMGGDSRDKFIQRIEKRRANREAEIIGSTPEETHRLVLTFILKATTSALDAHTNYFTPNEANQFMIQVQQRLFGIGAQLRDDLDGLSVVRLLEGGPAILSHKLKINDKIIAVNQEPVIGMDITEAVELIRGEKGSSVLLTILRNVEEEGQERHVETHEVEIVRNEVVLEETRLETQLEPYGDGIIANLRLFSFYQDPKSSAASDIRKAIETVQENHKLKGVVLDLRSNAGGLLTQAVNVTGLFIHKGVVVSVKDNTGRVQHLRELEGNPAWEGPLVVLVNRASASAAEIVAQSLQDYGRAIVVGDDHTFGKGSFQTFTLDPVNHPKVNPQGEYKVTRGRYYTVSGKSPQLVGAASDIVVPGILSQLEIGEKYAKFPLTNDAIDPHFEDDLSDLSPFHRLQLGPTYKYHLQHKMDIYGPYFEVLKKNSALRIASNKNYQSFIAEMEKKNFDADPIDLFGQSDLQLAETMNIMKDLIFLKASDETPLR